MPKAVLVKESERSAEEAKRAKVAAEKAEA